MLILLENSVTYLKDKFVVRTDDDEKTISFGYKVLDDEESFLNALKLRGKKYVWLYNRGKRKFRDMSKQERADYLGSSSVYLNFLEKEEGTNPSQCYFNLGHDFQSIPCVIRLGDHGNDYRQKELNPLYQNINLFISILVDEKERVKQEANSNKLIVDIELRVDSKDEKALEQITKYWDEWLKGGRHEITFNALLKITNNIKIVVSEQGKNYELSGLDELKQKIGIPRQEKDELETNSKQPQYQIKLTKSEMNNAIDQWALNNIEDIGTEFNPIKSPKDNNDYCRFDIGEYKYVGNKENGKYYFIKPNKQGGTINWQEMKRVNENKRSRRKYIIIDEAQIKRLRKKAAML